MKLYQATMSYFDGDHDHGCYQSPLFASREDAEAFKAAMINCKDDHLRWWTEDYSFAPNNLQELININEVEVVEHWDGIIHPASKYLQITFT